MPPHVLTLRDPRTGDQKAATIEADTRADAIARAEGSGFEVVSDPAADPRAARRGPPPRQTTPPRPRGALFEMPLPQLRRELARAVAKGVFVGVTLAAVLGFAVLMVANMLLAPPG